MAESPLRPIYAPKIVSEALPFAETMRTLLLVHYFVPISQVRPHLPEWLSLETFPTPAGRMACIALVCYRAVGFRPGFVDNNRLGLPVSGVNYRTYVRDASGPAVFFFGVSTKQFAPFLGGRVLGAPVQRAALRFGPDWDKGSFEIDCSSPWQLKLRAYEDETLSLPIEPFADQNELLRTLTDPVRGYLIQGRRSYIFSVKHPQLSIVSTGRIETLESEYLERLDLLRGNETPHSLIIARDVPFKLGLRGYR